MFSFDNIKESNFPYLIAEIGINHNGDLQIAKKLIDASFACDWNCVKFQKRNPDCIPEHQKMVMRKTPWGEMFYLDYKRRIELNKEDYYYIDKYCREKPIDWSASVWDIDSLIFLMEFDVPFIKIPSAMLTNQYLLAEVALTKKPIIMSTGMSTLEEIDRAVNWIFAFNNNLILMHTNSCYPSPHNELNLNAITLLKERYSNCIIGYSGHEEDLEPSVIAKVLGAKVIERHITLSHDLWGTDQKASLEITGMFMLRNRIDNIDVMLGNKEKIITENEMKKRKELKG